MSGRRWLEAAGGGRRPQDYLCPAAGRISQAVMRWTPCRDRTVGGLPRGRIQGHYCRQSEAARLRGSRRRLLLLVPKVPEQSPSAFDQTSAEPTDRCLSLLSASRVDDGERLAQPVETG